MVKSNLCIRPPCYKYEIIKTRTILFVDNTNNDITNNKNTNNTKSNNNNNNISVLPSCWFKSVQEVSGLRSVLNLCMQMWSCGWKYDNDDLTLRIVVEMMFHNTLFCYSWTSIASVYRCRCMCLVFYIHLLLFGSNMSQWPPVSVHWAESILTIGSIASRPWAHNAKCDMSTLGNPSTMQK